MYSTIAADLEAASVQHALIICFMKQIVLTFGMCVQCHAQQATQAQPAQQTVTSLLFRATDGSQVSL
jgi:hypothetical protein